MISNQLEKDIQPDRKMSILDTSKTKTNKNKTKPHGLLSKSELLNLMLQGRMPPLQSLRGTAKRGN